MLEDGEPGPTASNAADPSSRINESVVRAVWQLQKCARATKRAVDVEQAELELNGATMPADVAAAAKLEIERLSHILDYCASCLASMPNHDLERLLLHLHAALDGLAEMQKR